jgi:type IV secretion system protein VirB9
MRPTILLCFTAATALGACAGHGAVPQAPLAAAIRIGDTTAPAAAEPSAAVPTAMPRPLARHSARRSSRRASPALARVKAANRAAMQEPKRDLYVNALQVYPWVEGALYRLYTAPEDVSDIALQPGEALVSIAAGDTARWVIGDTTSGAGAARRVHVLAKPTSAGLATNLVITTDRRVYHIALESHAGDAMASISWTYPDDVLLAVRHAETAAAEGRPVAEGLDVERLSFGYRIEGDDPPWRPLRAFDDGSRVFIEFPPALGTGEAPPLFVRAEDGASELVNYRVRGRYYVVDRLFSVAELRLGGKKQQVVSIVRDGAAAPRKRRGKRS